MVTCQCNDAGYEFIRMAKIQTNSKNWKFVGGRLCLDFINTVGGRVGPATVLRDKLADYRDLLEWSRLASIANPTESRNLARISASRRQHGEPILARAVVLREALYRIFKAAIEGRLPRAADLEILGRELHVARAHERLTHTRGAFGWTFEDEPAVDRILWPVSLSAAELLTSGHLSRLRQCGGEECGWMFLDTSRNRSRRWCDMRDCGNRAKVRRFRDRRQRSHGRLRAAK
jgi:predicted RNA-binding Zn ribbon-like protein